MSLQLTLMLKNNERTNRCAWIRFPGPDKFKKPCPWTPKFELECIIDDSWWPNPETCFQTWKKHKSMNCFYHIKMSKMHTFRTNKLLASSKDVATIASVPPSISILEFHIKWILTDIRSAPNIWISLKVVIMKTTLSSEDKLMWL